MNADARAKFGHERRWVLPTATEAEARRLAEAYGMSVPLAMVMLSRGITGEARIDKFLNPRLSALSNPFLLPGMAKAVDIILGHVAAGSTILVYGDYDADGVTATALLIQVLSRLHAVAVPFLPNRLEDGYGLTPETLRRCVRQSHPQLVVTVDCGTSACAAAEEAARMGVDMVVTDHHLPTVDGLAKVPALVNPKLAEDEDTLMLAGVGVAFKLCHALVKVARERQMPGADEVDLRSYLDLVAMGTVADRVPLLNENRILVEHGLRHMNRTQSAGFQAMIRGVGLTLGELDTFQVGYVLAPRINAICRLGDANVALELVLTDDPVRAETLVKEVSKASFRRQGIESQIYEEAVAELEKTFRPEVPEPVVLSSRTWHAGVIGVVASRIVARYNRPAVLLTVGKNGVAQGSARSIPDLDILAHLTKCRGLMRHYGGHAMAAGIEVEEGNLPAFTEKFKEVCRGTLAGADLRRRLLIDAILRPEDVGMALYHSQMRIQPYGHSNPFPVWMVRRVKVIAPPVAIRDRHLRMSLQIGTRTHDVMGFNMAYRVRPQMGDVLDIAFNMVPNRYNPDELRLNLQDFRPAE